MEEIPQHAKFWDRFAAYLLDAVIIGGISFGINYLNIVHLKSFWIYLLFGLLGILYKPFFESRFKATIGKMALNLQVSDWNYNYIGFEKAVLRSLILIIPSFIYIPAHYLAFNNSYILDSNGVFEFSTKLNEIYPMVAILSSSLSWIVIADIIVYLVDINKKQRSLKDYIAKTYVVQKRK